MKTWWNSDFYLRHSRAILLQITIVPYSSVYRYILLQELFVMSVLNNHEMYPRIADTNISLAKDLKALDTKNLSLVAQIWPIF